MITAGSSDTMKYYLHVTLDNNLLAKQRNTTGNYCVTQANYLKNSGAEIEL